MQITQPGRAILAVDDDPMQVRLITTLLSSAGWTAFGTDEPQKAMAIVARENIGAAVLDLVMPAMSGLDLAVKLRGLRPNLPVVFFTAYPEEVEDLSDPVLRKPFSADTLVRAVGRALVWQGKPPKPPKCCISEWLSGLFRA